MYFCNMMRNHLRVFQPFIKTHLGNLDRTFRLSIPPGYWWSNTGFCFYPFTLWIFGTNL
ncbi:hypothetical protein CPB83DRAFT_856606 [Crepidotus variabilis]|uniref:Uncharacterized protein n=1 Tax=Crepidotus variabilis TaxID=179855 RepID=A0A9P6JNC2_9AGAR|nr:hypothetical protein CPB83DRAFT_856606 [Crepidotus variabilis]